MAERDAGDEGDEGEAVGAHRGAAQARRGHRDIDRVARLQATGVVREVDELVRPGGEQTAATATAHAPSASGFRPAQRQLPAMGRNDHGTPLDRVPGARGGKRHCRAGAAGGTP